MSASLPTVASLISKTSAPIRIMQLGDSLTEQAEGRRFLCEKLFAEGYHLEFVGSCGKDAFPGDRHEGHGSYTIGPDESEPGNLHANIDRWIPSANPDLITVLIGNNDYNGKAGVDPATAPQRLAALLARISALAPTATILVSTILKIAWVDDYAGPLNRALPGIVKQLQSAGHRVHLADLHNEVDLVKGPPPYETPGGDYLDGTHLNTSGARKLAAGWHPHIKRFLPPPAITALNQPYVATKISAPADTRQALDLYVPEGDGPFPLIVWIHGGGWHLGDRRIDFAASFNRAGFAVASLSYRMTNEGHPFPAQIEDCLAGLAWLTKNARAHRLDPYRIGLIGHSAGAHLCALLLTCGESGPFNKTAHVRAHAAVLWSPVLDLAFERGRWPATSPFCNPRDPFHLHFFPGGAYDESFAAWASPTTYLRTALPPLLIVHHVNDPLVPIGQAREFARLAREAGTEVKFRPDTRTLPDPHNILCPELFAEALAFFRTTLGPR